MNALRSTHEEWVKMLEEKESIATFHNHEQSKQIQDLQKTTQDVEAHLK